MGVVLHAGDCLDVMRAMAERGETVQAIVTDPPYHLTSIVKRFGGGSAAPAQFGTDGAFARASRGFMGKTWDGGDIAMRPETWALAYALLPPGGHLAAFGGTRTCHRMAVAIEDAGFEIRDTLMWVYGTGFPKSHDVAKGIDKAAGREGAVTPTGSPVKRMIPGADQDATGSWIKDNGRVYQPGEYDPATDEARQWSGWGTALKPAWEPIILARKPLAGTVAANVLAHGTGALNIDGCRVATQSRPLREKKIGSPDVPGHTTYGAGLSPVSKAVGETDLGRWPANVLHDGSDEVEEAFALYGERPGQQGRSSTNPETSKTRSVYGAMGHMPDAMRPRGDTGTAARFFYSAKATAADRAGSKHPTVKPVALMRWLCRLITPPGGTILDPFAGSGTTGAAALAEGFNAVLIEREAEYQADIRQRLALKVEAAPAPKKPTAPCPPLLALMEGAA